MKNKKLIWLLAPAVLLIWGLIAYRVVQTVLDDSKPVPVASALPLSGSSPNLDTGHYELQLDYDDPFLKNSGRRYRAAKPQKNKPETKKKKPKVIKKVKKLPLKWPPITYQGIIDGHKNLCLLQVSGTSVFMTEGEEKDDIKLLEVFKDSVRVEYKGDGKKTIVKK